MIGRIWHGWTMGESADAYQRLLEQEVLPGIRSRVQGFDGACVLRREDGDRVRFLTLTLWDSLEAIETLVGHDNEAAYVPDEAKKLLEQFDERVVHYEVVLLGVSPIAGSL